MPKAISAVAGIVLNLNIKLPVNTVYLWVNTIQGELVYTRSVIGQAAIRIVPFNSPFE